MARILGNQNMRRRLTAGLLMAVTVLAAQGAAAATRPCDRACLTRVTNAYLRALVAHDPRGLPLAAKVKFTEDGAPLELGDGLWRTVTGLGSYRLDFADPSTGAAGALVLVQENGTPALMALRFKAVGGRISEVETLLARKGELQSLQTDLLTEPLAILTQDAPPQGRSSRAELTRIVGSYFDAIEKADGSLTPFAEDGFRIENGVRTCNKPASDPAPGMPAEFAKLGAMPCADQLSTKIFTYIRSVRPRRFVVVDQQRGLVLALVRFNHPGDTPYADTPGFGRVSMAGNPWAVRPTSALIAELFKIQDHKIQRIMAVITNVPYRMPTGWER